MTDENPINRLDEIGRKALEALEKVSEGSRPAALEDGEPGPQRAGDGDLLPSHRA